MVEAFFMLNCQLIICIMPDDDDDDDEAGNLCLYEMERVHFGMNILPLTQV